MVRLLFLLIVGAITLSLVFFQFHTVPVAKKMTIAGGGFLAAASAVSLQISFPWYYPLLAIVAISLMSALLYMKILEREQKEKERLATERKERLQQMIMASPSPEQTAAEETAAGQIQDVAQQEEADEEPERMKELVSAKPFGMESIRSVGEDEHRGQ